MVAFQKDVSDGMDMLVRLGYKTDIFVYPYAYEPVFGSSFLRRMGFRYIFAGRDSQRTPMEEL